MFGCVEIYKEGINFIKALRRSIVTRLYTG
jgi:hypothetical protein